MTDTEPRTEPTGRCGYEVVALDGEAEPCDRPATGWRWYQDCAHEDTLDVACEFHANEGGRRIAQAEAEVRRLRAENDELHRTLLDETYRPEGGEIVMRELREAQRERDEARAENTELTAAHSLMAAQFTTMQREKEHGWQLADRYEAERDEARTEVQRLRNEIIGWDHGAAILRADLERARATIAAVEGLHFERKGVCWECPQHDWPCPTARALAAPVEQAGAER